MKKIIFSSLLLCLSSFTLAESDPFRPISIHTLQNGMKVIISPDANSNLVKVKVNVGVGFVHETEENYGVSHLLEHVLFRNEKLKDDMSYLQLIKEKEGSANGTTSWDRTNYFATMKKPHAEWLIKNIHEMIMKPSLSPKHVETEKRTVMLEIGEPSPWIRALGFDVFKLFHPSYLQDTPFWEKYFNVKLKSHYTRTEEQLRVLRLTHAQVSKHYKEYYDPSNMQIIVSGGIDPKKTLKLIDELWGKHPTNNKGDLRPKYEATLSDKPFRNFSFSSNRNAINLGYMADDLSLQETTIMSTYMEFLSHRLMKKLRNLNGETYTAYDRNDIRQDFGYFSIYFPTTKEKFWENYNFVREMMKEDIFGNGLTDDDIEEAKKMFLSSFVLWGKQAEGSARLAEVMFEANEPYGSWLTPTDVLSPVTPEVFRATLKKIAKPENEYVNVAQPELLFYLDYIFLGALCALGFFFFFRKLLQKPFKNDHVLWVRKVRYPPLKLLEMFVGLVVYVSCMHLGYISDLFINSSFIASTGIFAKYLDVVLSMFVIVASAQFVISYFPRKLYFMDDHLVIKSLSYYSRKIHKDEIQRVSEMAWWKLLFNPVKMMKAWNSFFYFNPRFWQKGVLVELKSGKLYFFSSKDSKKSCEELKGLLVDKTNSGEDLLREVA